MSREGGLAHAEMEVPVTEIRRFRELLLDSQLFTERRVESFSVEGEFSYHWTVSQQVRVPCLADETRDSRARPVLLSLGLFSKVRLPDLRAFDCTGRELVVLSRRQRAYLLASQILTKYRSSITVDDEMYTRCERLIALIIERSETEALRARKLLLLLLAVKQHPLAGDERFQQETRGLCTTAHLIAIGHARPEQQVVTRITFSDEIHSGRTSEPVRVSPTAKVGRLRPSAWPSNVLDLLAYLGFIPHTLERRCATADHTQSYHLIAKAPTGAEIARLYWNDIEARHPNGSSPVDATERFGSHECSEETISFRPEIGALKDNSTCSIEVRQSRRGPLRGATWLLAWAAVAAGLAARYAPELRDSSAFAASLFTAVPATISGLLARTAPGFATKLAQGPRMMAMIGSTAALAFGFSLILFHSDA